MALYKLDYYCCYYHVKIYSCHKSVGKLLLLSARLAITFQAAEHLVTSTKLYCLGQRGMCVSSFCQDNDEITGI